MDSLIDAEQQEALADSLVSGPVGDWRNGTLTDQGETTHDPESTWEDPGQAFVDAEFSQERQGQQPGEQQQPIDQEQPQQTEAYEQELSPQQIQQGIQELGETVERLGLNDQEAATNLAYDLSAPFGADPRTINSEALGQTMASAVLSAVQIAENGGTELGPVPPHAAQAFTSDFLRSLGVDPRTSGVDSQQFANVMLSGLVNFIDTVKIHGVNASLDRLNDPQACEWFAKGILQSFGSQSPVTREYALHLADAGGKYILSVLRNLEQAQPQPRQGRQVARQSHGSRSGSSRQKSGRVPWKSNQDIFSEDTMEAYQLRHGAL